MPRAASRPRNDVGSEGSAAGGGKSDLSEWPRSARDEGVRAKDIRRAPQQGILHYAFCIFRTTAVRQGRYRRMPVWPFSVTVS